MNPPVKKNLLTRGDGEHPPANPVWDIGLQCTFLCRNTSQSCRDSTPGMFAPFFAETKVKVAETALPERQVQFRQSTPTVYANSNPAECNCTGTDDGKPD